MVHGDDKGLVLPPRVASVQVIIVPVGITVKTTPEQRDAISAACTSLQATLKQGGVRVKTDLRDNYTPGYKFNHWELRVLPTYSGSANQTRNWAKGYRQE
jgi:prolyl-tRNA synthetase